MIEHLTLAAQVPTGLITGFAAGLLAPSPVAATYTLDEAVAAYAAVETGKGEGRHVILPNGM